jgi:hypothetical protein
MFGGIAESDFSSKGLKAGIYAVRISVAGKNYMGKVLIQP